MKAQRRAWGERLGARLAGAGCAALVAGVAAAQPTQTAGGFPSFGTVPAAPNDVRSASAWRAAVLDTRVVGARLARSVAKEPWTLDDTAGWVGRARNEARPPPAVTTPSQADDDAVVKAMKARASRPSRRR